VLPVDGVDEGRGGGGMGGEMLAGWVQEVVALAEEIGGQMDVCVEQTGRELQSLYLTLHASCAEHAIRSKQARMLTYSLRRALAASQSVYYYMCVSSHCCMCPHTAVCVLILSY
jgi:hypothetical protein